MKNRPYFFRRPWRSVGAVAATVGLSIGLAAGVFVSQWSQDSHNFWPDIPVHATATNSQDNYAIATGALVPDIEALFFLDALTGDLKATIINNRSQQFQAFFQRNILKDFGDTPLKNPRFLMVTGRVSFQNQANRRRLGDCVVYVMELQSGQCVAYGIPDIVNRAAVAGQKIQGELFLLDKVQFRKVKVRDEGA